jgi:Tol biopolymer transport system component
MHRAGHPGCRASRSPEVEVGRNARVGPGRSKTVRRRRLGTTSLAFLLLWWGPFSEGVFSQYFGRNKVQYRTFDYQVLKTEHFDIYYDRAMEEIIPHVALMSERWYARLSSVLGHELSGRQPLILYDSHPAFRQTNALPGEVGEATGGATEILKRRIVMPLAGPLAETDHVLGHELVHAFQFDMTGFSGEGVGFQIPGAMRLPLWFVEGMAEYLSLGPVDAHTSMWMRDAAFRDDLPTLRQLNDPRYFPYRYGQAFWSYVAGRWGDRVVGRLLVAASRAGSVEAALREVLESTGDELTRDWHEATQRAYAPLKEATHVAETYGHPVVFEERQGGRINVAPALSPDGRRLVFLSERDLFSIEMFLADAETGRILRRITRTAVDPHFESLQFVNSAGAWSPDGRLFVFGAVARGRPVLTVIDVESGRTTREIRFPDLGEVFNPTWSPDGRRIAFSAIADGVTDLYFYDLDESATVRLTDDVFAALQPAWSPDGRRIAFVTDRFTGNLEDLHFGEYRLAMLDMETGRVREIVAFDRGKHINPQWSADGRTLYFVSDSSGISDIYRLNPDDGTLSQVTRLRSGASGISKLSPALSVAAGADRLAYSVYRDGGYRIFVSDDPRVLAGESPVELPGPDPAALPPLERRSIDYLVLLGDPRRGLVEPKDFERTRYRPRLGLDYVAQPNISVGTSSFGAFMGGGTALLWSDMVGDHNVVTLFQVESSSGNILNDTAVLGAYENRRGRWNWGGLAGQVPFVTGSLRRTTEIVDGEPAGVEEVRRFWQINREVSARASYPFSRAQRVEFTGGYRNISFAAETQRSVFSLQTGRLIQSQRIQLPSPDSLHLGTAGAALVYDTSVFGGTGPVIGQRYRFELSQVAGDLHYQSALLDYRHYVMPFRPVTLAGRMLHLGRYGADSEDGRLQDLFLGFTSLVRGYRPGSFRAAECVAPDTAPGACPVFDRLLGSRALVGNVELRVPLLGVLGVLGGTGFPPVETALFYDAGVAWTSAESPTFAGGDRRPVSSHGVAFRVNLMGFAVAQFSAVHPNDRPLQGWHLEFALTPGF